MVEESEDLQETAVEKDESVGELEKEEVSQSKSAVNTIMMVGGDEPQAGHNVTVSTVSMISAATDGQHAPSERVKVLIEYPKNWKKQRHFKDGDVKEIAPETADQFIKAGFATLVKEDNSK